MADYPTGIKTFVTWSNGDDIDASNQNEPNDEITAIETGLLQGTTHNLQAPGFRLDNADSVTITTGVITVTSGYVEVDTEGAAASDDLDTITIGLMASGPAIGEGSILVLQSANASRVVTVKNGTGNIVLMGGDFIMNSTSSRLTLMYSGSNWVGISRTIETGTWTPVIGGAGGTSGQAYNAALTGGRWTKNGSQVTLNFIATLTTKGTITGGVQIQGSPFTLADGVPYAAVTIGYWNTLATNWMFLAGYIVPNTSAIVLHGRQTAGTDTVALATADIANGTSFIGSVTFTSKN